MKNGFYLVIAIILLSYGVYFYYVSDAFKKYKKPTSELENKILKLELDKNTIQKNLDSINFITKKLNATIDSIESLKPKIKIKYVEKYRQIDSSNSNYISKEFDSIFTANNIK